MQATTQSRTSQHPTTERPDLSCMVQQDTSGVSCQEADSLRAGVDHYFDCIEDCRVDDSECLDDCIDGLKEEESLA